MVTTAHVPYIYVGGELGGLVRQQIGEDNKWKWEKLSNGLPSSLIVTRIAVHPQRPEMVLVGARDGLYISGNNGDSWTKADLGEPNQQGWSFAFHPQDPETIYLGTSQASPEARKAGEPMIFRSIDGGDNWIKLNFEAEPAAMCPDVHEIRVIQMAINPVNPSEIYAGVEVGGMYRSLDSGESWEPINNGLIDEEWVPGRAGTEAKVDIHSVRITEARPDTVMMIGRLGTWESKDRGDNWEFIDLSRFSPIVHTRELEIDPHDPSRLYMVVGQNPFADTGCLMRSRDAGLTWERIDRGVEPSGTGRAVCVDSRDPSHIYWCTRYGQVFSSENNGYSWQEHPLRGTVTEIRGFAIS